MDARKQTLATRLNNSGWAERILGLVYFALLIAGIRDLLLEGYSGGLAFWAIFSGLILWALFQRATRIGNILGIIQMVAGVILLLVSLTQIEILGLEGRSHFVVGLLVVALGQWVRYVFSSANAKSESSKQH